MRALKVNAVENLLLNEEYDCEACVSAVFGRKAKVSEIDTHETDQKQQHHFNFTASS